MVSGGARDGAHPGLLKATGKPSRLYCGLVALAYMSFAVTLLLFNKAALSSYNFPNANVITLAQLCCANALLYAMRKCRVIGFTDDVTLIPRDCINGRTGFPVRFTTPTVRPRRHRSSRLVCSGAFLGASTWLSRRLPDRSFLYTTLPLNPPQRVAILPASL